MNDVFKPIRPKKISEEIVEQLRDAIYEGKLQPGQSLPAERDLAKSLGVSRVSLREALNTLQAMGLLEIQQGNRTFVRPLTTLSIYDPLVTYTKKSPQNMFQVFEVRKHMEAGITSLAAERATRAELDRLQAIFREMEADLKKNRLGARADMDFHSVLTEASRNFPFQHLMKTIYDLLQEELRIAWGSVFTKAEQRETLFSQHQEILDAVLSRDPKRAGEAAFAHLQFVEERWIESLAGEMSPSGRSGGTEPVLS